MGNKTRTHVVIPEDLIADIDALIGKRKRSRFITQVAEKEIKRLKFLRTIDETSGAWSGEDHPELEKGSYNWIKKQRISDEENRTRGGA
jgi:hypothetical protein